MLEVQAMLGNGEAEKEAIGPDFNRSIRKAQLKPEQCNSRKTKVYHRLEQILLVPHCGDKDVKRIIKRLKRHKAELFTFLEREDVSPYNNHAEQQMRKPVTTRKVSQQNRSEQGAKAQAILMSLFRTAELKGQNPIEVVLSLAKSALAGNAFVQEFFKLAA